jgi:antitoxin ParD1/3/4
MATMNVSLPEPMREWVKAKTSDGLYANSSDYVRDLIRQDQLRSQQIQALQNAIDESLASGEPRAFDAEAFKQKMRS